MIVTELTLIGAALLAPLSIGAIDPRARSAFARRRRARSWPPRPAPCCSVRSPTC